MLFRYAPVLSTISAHGRALKHVSPAALCTICALSTISAHGRALKRVEAIEQNEVMYGLSTISAHGRALKRDDFVTLNPGYYLSFNNFGSR